MSDCDLADRLGRIESLLQKHREQISADALWTLREARVRLSRGINPHSLTEDELEEVLGDRRTMSRHSLDKLRKDDLCPITAIEVAGILRIREEDIRRYPEQKRQEARPNS
jgi:hypothetical protein